MCVLEIVSVTNNQTYKAGVIVFLALRVQRRLTFVPQVY